MNEQEAIAYWNKLSLLFDDDGRICFIDAFDEGSLLWVLDSDGWTVRDAAEFSRIYGYDARYTLPDSDVIEDMRHRYRMEDWEDEDET